MTALYRTALRALMGTLAAFAIGGCAATNVANTWQCPLVEGSVCARVAEVDPAAPKRVSMDTPANASTAKEPSVVRARRYRNATGARAPVTRAAAAARTGESEPTCRGNCRPQDRPDEAPAGRRDTPAVTGTDGSGAEPEGSWRGGARTPEVLGRIWIAPYVDTSGVYHEASWVRVVIEPADWKTAP